MKKLNLALAQYDIAWEDKIKNRRKIEGLISSYDKNADIILLPEMFSTGFTMSPDKVAESMEGETIQWMKDKAAAWGSAIAGSIVIKEDKNFYNRFLFIYPSAEIKYYDKKHLFSYGRENKHYSGGDSQLVFEYKNWTIMPFVCYDLRFPVWMRNPGNVDLYLGVANWPDTRITAWDVLLRSRAIENQAYLAAVNRIGRQPGSLKYNGHSSIIRYDGAVTAFSENEEKIIDSDLNKEELKQFRDSFRFLDDKDEFQLL
jgi:predicted amidohydrolase